MLTQITAEDLKILYDNNTSKELCLKLKITKPTLYNYLKKAGIKLKGKGSYSRKYLILKEKVN